MNMIVLHVCIWEHTPRKNDYGIQGRKHLEIDGRTLQSILNLLKVNLKAEDTGHFTAFFLTTSSLEISFVLDCEGIQQIIWLYKTREVISSLLTHAMMKHSICRKDVGSS